MIKRNSFVDLEDRLVAVGPNSDITSNFLPLLWRHSPRALLFFTEVKPAAVMVRQVEKIYSGWRFPLTTVPMKPEVYSNVDWLDPFKLMVRMVTESNICLSIELDSIDDKLLMAPYRQEFGLDPDEAIYFQGDYEDCQWLEYLLFIQQHRIMPKDGQRCIMSFEEYVEYRKTPEERLLDLCGRFSI